MGARLARYTQNETYANWAIKTWDWIMDVKYIDKDWNVFDGGRTSTRISWPLGSVSRDETSEPSWLGSFSRDVSTTRISFSILDEVIADFRSCRRAVQLYRYQSAAILV